MLGFFLSGNYTFPQMLYFALIMFLALMLSFSVHEFMHCFVATKLGDNTAYYQGRYTLNPFAHVDPVGLACMLLVGFGWGKPVPVNTSRLDRIKNRKLASVLVYLAGVTGNFILALIATIILYILRFVVGGSGPVFESIYYILQFTAEFSFMLLAFNLLPLSPLDGFNVIYELLPLKAKMSNGFRQFVQYSPMIMLGLIILGRFSNIDILGMLVSLIGYPFRLVCNYTASGITMGISYLLF